MPMAVVPAMVVASARPLTPITARSKRFRATFSATATQEAWNGVRVSCME